MSSELYIASPFLRLPAEIRLMIYELLVLPTSIPSSTHSTSVTNLIHPDHHNYEGSSSNSDFNPHIIYIRTIDPFLHAASPSHGTLRSRYSIRSGRFRAATALTTYKALLSPYTSHLSNSLPSLMLLNHQIHAEATKVLYQTYTFSFSTAIEAIVPFLSDLTPTSRSHIRRIEFTKRALPYTKEFDRCEWDAATEYLALSLPRLSHLQLNVVAGKPRGQGVEGWEGVSAIEKRDFEVLRKAREEWGGGDGGFDLAWVEQLFRIQGLKGVDVRAVVEHCPPPVSETMAFWVAFSKSVEGGFGEWVREVMC